MRFSKTSIFCLFITSYLAQAVFANENMKHFDLGTAEKKAVKNSPDLLLTNSNIKSLEQKIALINKRKLPQLELEGNYTYIETVPEISLPTGKVSLGDNENYSVGPTILYKLFDGGILRDTAISIRKLKESESSRSEYIVALTKFATRVAYMKVLIAKEQLLLSRESLQLSQEQHEDILKKGRFGAASELDLSISKRNLLNHKLKYSESLVLLKKQAIDLSTLVLGEKRDSKYFIPISAKVDFGIPSKFDSLENILLSMQKNEKIKRPAQINSIDLKIGSARKEIDIVSASYWPQISIKAKSSIDYPNGPKLETIHQNSVGINLTMPIFDWGIRSTKKAEKLSKVNSLIARRKKIVRDLEKKIQIVSEELNSLKEKESISSELVIEAKKILKINIKSHKSGKIQFLEVERSNIKMFEAEMNNLLLKGQIFLKLSQLAALNTGGLNE